MSIQTQDKLKAVYEEYNTQLSKLPEKWEYINIGNIASGYKISNHGKILSLHGKQKATEFKRSYEYVKLYHTDGTRSSYQVHRLVAITFLKIPDKYLECGYSFDNLQVNHINGIQYCNAIFNLEWCTPKENTDHAHKTGLAWKLHCENNSTAILTNSMVHEICKYLEEGKSNEYIKSKIDVSDRIIHSIRSHETWNDISCYYDFTDRKNSFDDNTIHLICKDIASGEMSGQSIAQKYGVSCTYVHQLRRKEFRPDITNQYDFSKFMIKEQIPDDIIHSVCADIESGKMTLVDIAAKHHISKSYVGEIKRHKKRIDISRHYNF